jgi:hypothetical protein
MIIKLFFKFNNNKIYYNSLTTVLKKYKREEKALEFGGIWA